MSKFKVNDEVIVTSECLAKGHKGIVQRVSGGRSLVELTDLPHWHYGNATRWFRNASLDRVPGVSGEAEPKKSPRIGVFLFTDEHDNDLKPGGIANADNALIVGGHSKEHCLSQYNKELSSNHTATPTRLYFDGVLYKLDVITRLEIIE